MTPMLRKKVVGAVAGGAMAIAAALLGGHEGLEGRKYTAYYDVAGVLTLCDGHTGHDIIRGKHYSDQECDALLQRDLQPVKKWVDNAVQVPIGDYTRAALYSFTYNVGYSAFIQSTLLKKLNSGDISAACDELRRWIMAGGQRWQGLINRREVERELCLMPPLIKATEG
ncbi:lysozyme [Yersinia kristensenii]|uniref:lysozyme n=1 Tax=Yersinia kristensenii TaxID=28152 RepID=UPI0001A54B18|nr:lysozyme [Yersinia kristensenii]EEP92446.1 Phage lysozyme [Yersinia kristensenii ATCC 33638]PEH53008.1 lysozyme [Yersinia kristensenii]SUP70887.1 putative phage lysozyme [Yersinia kristensenii]